MKNSENANGVTNINAKLVGKITAQLKEELKKRKLKTIGVKNELVLRLITALQLEREHGESQDHDDSEDERNHKDICRKESSDNSDNDVDSDAEEFVPRDERQRINEHRRR